MKNNKLKPFRIFIDCNRGKCSIEYKLDGADPVAGVAESVGYFKGVIVSV